MRCDTRALTGHCPLSVCIVTILRIISLIQLNFADISYSIVTATIWGCLEPCLGIMSACLPVLPPLIARMFKCTTLTWLRRPSASPTYTSTWPGTPATPRSLRPRKLGSVKFHRLYDVGNLLGNPPDGALLPPLLADEESSCMEMENQSDPESLRNIRISKGWHQTKAGTFAPPSSPKG